MSPANPELSSAELLREARQAFAPHQLDAPPAGPTIEELLREPLSSDALLPQRAVDYFAVSTEVLEGPTIEELLREPLSSDALLPQRAVDPWAPEPATDATPAAPNPDDLAPPPPNPLTPRKTRIPGSALIPPSQNLPPGYPTGPPAGQPTSPPWLDPMRGELGLPTAGQSSSHPPAPPTPQPPGYPTGPPAGQPTSPPWLDPMRGELGLLTAQPQPRPPARRRLGPPVRTTQRTSFPWRPVLFGFIALAALIGSAVGEDATPVTQLQVGDCFAAPGDRDFTRVTYQDCDGLHDVQVYAQVQGSVTNNVAAAAQRCQDELFDLFARQPTADQTALLPGDTVTYVIDDSRLGSRRMLCTVESPSGGLTGSLLPD